MPNSSQSPISWDLLDSVPASADKNMIVQRPGTSDRDLAFFYQEAATRLAATHEGNPIDDTILLPYLMLYRQAFELQLKAFTKYLAAMRRKYREPNNPDLAPEAIASKLRKPHEIGHKMEPLLAELLSHYNALDLKEPFPPEVARLLALLHQADSTGTFFRYSGNLPTQQTRVDFRDLAALFDSQFNMLQGVEDWVDNQFQNLPDSFQY